MRPCALLRGAARLAPALLLAACAAPIRDPWGMAVARGDSPPLRAPAAFQADLGVLPRARGALPFSARLYGEVRAAAVPRGDSSGPPARRYRLDLFGFPSAIAASWLWSDGRWLLVRHDRREAISGEGPALDMEDPPVRIPDVPAVLGVLAGELLPGYPGAGATVAPDSGIVRWRVGNEDWEARIDPATGLCLEVKSPALALRYARPRLHGGIVIPEKIDILAGGDTLLSLTLRDWKASPTWKKDPFDLVAPPGYASGHASGFTPGPAR